MVITQARTGPSPLRDEMCCVVLCCSDRVTSSCACVACCTAAAVYACLPPRPKLFVGAVRHLWCMRRSCHGLLYYGMVATTTGKTQTSAPCGILPHHVSWWCACLAPSPTRAAGAAGCMLHGATEASGLPMPAPACSMQASCCTLNAKPGCTASFTSGRPC